MSSGRLRAHIKICVSYLNL